MENSAKSRKSFTWDVDRVQASPLNESKVQQKGDQRLRNQLQRVSELFHPEADELANPTISDFHTTEEQEASSTNGGKFSKARISPKKSSPEKMTPSNISLK